MSGSGYIEAMAVKHPVERGGSGRGRFDRIAESASNLSSSAAFFVLCTALVVAWTLSYLLGWSDPLRFFLGDLLGAITLILVALLKNAELRAEHAVQFKLDAIAEALLEVRRGTDEGAADDLERAIGRHNEV
jgi:low affinity Fe/Cu permease